VEAQRVAALEAGVEAGAEGRVGEQPGDFVLVLVGQQLEVVAGHRVGEGLAAQRASAARTRATKSV
jgi:hypothetical protein